MTEFQMKLLMGDSLLHNGPDRRAVLVSKGTCAGRNNYYCGGATGCNERL